MERKRLKGLGVTGQHIQRGPGISIYSFRFQSGYSFPRVISPVFAHSDTGLTREHG